MIYTHLLTLFPPPPSLSFFNILLSTLSPPPLSLFLTFSCPPSFYLISPSLLQHYPIHPLPTSSLSHFHTFSPTLSLFPHSLTIPPLSLLSTLPPTSLFDLSYSLLLKSISDLRPSLPNFTLPFTFHSNLSSN